MKLHLIAAAMLLAGNLAHAAGTASLTADGYGENFDSLGTTGTTLPTGWANYSGLGDKGSWKNTIPASGTVSVATMVLNTNNLTATSSTPSSTNINGYNARLSSSATSDRVIASSPTGIAGVSWQLSLVNDTGSAFDELTVSYDTVRYTNVGTDTDNIYGYWLFYSLDGASWTNVSALNPTLANFPITTGVTSVADASIALSSAVAPGSTLILRWVDDNGSPSPDQVIGLNNVLVSAVPEPGTYALLLAGAAAVGFIARRRKA